jgi:histidyl-tRNA synthetase
MNDLIEPRVLKGFRDFLPDKEAQRLATLKRLEQVYRLFGFVPIDTPVLEYTEILLGKGGGDTDKQVYRFTDHGGRDVAMRYDLTVPFARFMAAHLAELPLPFKRWHAAKVWRGENTQRGRYREFVQVDFDVVGSDSASADIEILLLIRESMAALGIAEFAVHFAHRGLFNAFLARLGLGANAVEVLHTIDKERKIGRDKTREMLESAAGSKDSARILDFIKSEGSFSQTLAKLREAVGPTDGGDADDAAREALRRLSAIGGCLEELGLASSFVLDPSITRGLDYYTGIVCETFLSKLPAIGSVCSGGRYNNLASLYTKQSLPGVGASIGLDRLMAAMEELGLLAESAASSALLVLNLEDGLLGAYHRFAEAFRARGIATEVYPEKKKLAVQFAFAEKKGIPLALLHGTEERAEGRIVIKDLRNRREFGDLTLESAIGKAKELLR